MCDVNHAPDMQKSAIPPSSPRDALGATPWLQAVAPATLDRLAQQAVLHRMPSGSILFEQSETPAFAQFLVGGRVDLIAIHGEEESRLETVEPVDLLLPAAVLSRQIYLARARALAEVHLVLIHAQAFRDAVASDHALCLAVLACQAAQFRRQLKHEKNQRLRSADERVGCYLLRLLRDFDTPVRLPIEKRHIARELGMTRETFSRSLASMQHHGVAIHGDTVELIDADAFSRRFQSDPSIDGTEQIAPLPLVRH